MIDLPLIAIDVSRIFILVLAEPRTIEKFILGQVCLKAVVKVAPSLQKLASAWQVKIANHMMIVLSQLPPKKKLPYAEQIAVEEEEEESEDMLLSQFTDDTDLTEWYFNCSGTEN